MVVLRGELEEGAEKEESGESQTGTKTQSVSTVKHNIANG